MRRKRDLTTNVITKYKARLNIHGGKQVYGMNYYKTYAPVVTWYAIRLIITFSILFGLSLHQVDFVLPYMQAPVETHLYMELPQGIKTKYSTSKDHVLKLLANLYGHKSKLVEYGTNTSWTNWQVSGSSNWQWMRILSFYCDDIIFIVYVDVGIFLGPSAQVLTQVLWEIKNTSLDIEDQGYPSDYVGVNVHKQADGMYNFTQRTLIDAIILDVGLKDKYTKPVPAKASLHLHAFKDSPTFDDKFNYRSIVGKLNYLAQTIRPDIMYTTHQIAKYSSDPRR